jgi:serine phosphatase RsbU (regulator of sigma subunit)
MNPLPELVDFSRSFRDLAEQINLRRAHREQMASAKAIQRSMLPDRGVLAASRDLVDVQADMRSAQDVGGDLYDFVPLDPDRLAITIGDVCGKGIPAALFMAMTQTVMRYTLCYETDLAAALKAGNALLAASNRERMFATFFCGVLDIRSGGLCYCTCGHQAPVLLRNGRITELVSSPNLPLGLRSTVTFKTDQTVLERGDRLLLYTDGFTDATNEQGEQFGDARFLETVTRLSAVDPQQLIPRLLQAVDEFAAGAPQFDDLTSVLISMRAK